MKKYLLSTGFIVLFFVCSVGQNVTITPSGITPAMGGAASYPRISYNAILALASPQIGDMAYDTTFLCLRVYNGSKWVCTHQFPNEPNMAAIASAGGTSYDYSYGVAVDAGGNVYITGYFMGTATFGGTTKTSAGNYDIFVAKYNSSGTLQWVQTAGGSSYDAGRDIAVDAGGNVYVIGNFQGTATFGGTIKTSKGSDDIFVAKYNSSGTLQWVQTAGGSYTDYISGVAVDAGGNVYITGYFYDTVTFGGTSKTSAGWLDIFVAKYNNSGTLQWLQTAGGSSYDYSYGVAVDSGGNVYITGTFQSTATFGSTTKTSAGGADVFLAKYDPVGTSWVWVQTAGGTNDDRGCDTAVDAGGNVFITGYFQATATFGGTTKTSAGNNDIFLAKYNSSGTLLWVQTAGGTNDDIARSVAVDVVGNAYITGNFQGTATFGGTSKTSAGNYDIFVAKYNSSGTLQWVQTGGGISYDYSLGVAVDAGGNVFITGYFHDTAIFGGTAKTSAGFSDIFMARIQQ
jgi:hypothetical protein